MANVNKGYSDVEESKKSARESGTISTTMETDSASNNLKFGYGSCTPAFLQKLHGPKCLLLFLSLCTVIQGMVVNGLVPVSITTFEKRFNLNSTQSGLFSSFYDVAVLAVLIPVCHWGNKGHKGKWIGWGMLLMAMGSFVIALPQFTSSSYSVGREISELCLRNGQSVNCQPTGSKLHLYLFVLLFGQVFNGFGASPLYTLGISYIDENVSQNASPVYLGIYLAASTIGPAMGFIIGAFSLSIWGDIGKSDPIELGISGTNDPRWYGAWWIPFIFTGIMSLIFCIPILGYPRELPDAKSHRKKDIDQTHDHLTGDFGEKLTDLPKYFCRLMSNKTFSALIIMQTADAFLMNGFITFVPKIFENLFNLSASKASMIAGGIVVPMGVLGNIIGGLILQKWKLQCKAMIKLSLVFNSVTIFLLFIFFTQCMEIPFAGVSKPYMKSSPLLDTNLVNNCNSDCLCSDRYEPVCSNDLFLSYYSPCHAGCSTKFNGTSNFWNNCTCVVDAGLEKNIYLKGTVVSGLCTITCGGITLFMIFFALLVLVTFLSAMPVQQAVLRCVPFQLRTISLGFTWIFMRLFGSIPGAILFGLAIDYTCILWREDCGIKQTCLRYNNWHLSLSIFGFGIVLQTVVIVSLYVAYICYRPPTVGNNGSFENTEYK